MSDTPAAIRFKGMGQVFKTASGPLEALRGVDFSVTRHEFVAVLGPSGCGKSTLLRSIAGLLRPTSGSIEVFGLTVTEPRDDIGIVFQKPTLLPWANVEDNVVFPIKHKTGRVGVDDRVKARNLLNMVGLEGFEKRMPAELSGGMQQRVGIARALLLNPDILLMDEPFSALDEQNKVLLQEELLRIWEETRKTVLFITHSVDEAVTLGDRIMVMTAHPGREKATLEVPFERPRQVLELRARPEYGEFVFNIWSYLREEVQRARAQDEGSAS